MTLTEQKPKENKRKANGLANLSRTGVQGGAQDCRAKMTQNLPQSVLQRFAL